MIQAQATNPKAIETNKAMYKWSKQDHARNGGGTIGIAHDWPLDCYDTLFWNGLSTFEQEMISKVPAIGIQEISNELSKRCGTSQQSSSSGPPDHSSASRGKKQGQTPAAVGPVTEEIRMISGPLTTSGSMNVD